MISPLRCGFCLGTHLIQDCPDAQRFIAVKLPEDAHVPSTADDAMQAVVDRLHQWKAVARGAFADLHIAGLGAVASHAIPHPSERIPRLMTTRHADFYYRFKCGHQKAEANRVGPRKRCRVCAAKRLAALEASRAQARQRYHEKRRLFNCGHPMTPENTRMAGKYRRCITCDHTRAERKAKGPTRKTQRGIPTHLHLDPVVLKNFAPKPLAVIDTSGRSYTAFPLKRFA